MNKSTLYRSSFVFLCILGALLIFVLLGGTYLGVLAAPPTVPGGSGWRSGETLPNPDHVVVRPTGGNQATAVSNLIYNGSFEETAQLGWSEYLNNTDCGTTKIGDWTSVFPGVPAYDGYNTLWVGGYCGSIPISNSAEQWVVIPANAPILSFWYYAWRSSPDSAVPDDFAYVDLVSEEQRIWELPMSQANNTETWTNVRIDLSAYAGQEVVLSFGNIMSTADSLVGNVLFDYITTEPLPPVTGAIDPETGGTVTFTDAQGSVTKITAPPGAVSAPVIVRFAPVADPGHPVPGTFANHAFDLDVFENLIYLPMITGNGSAASSSLPAGAVDLVEIRQPTSHFTFTQPLTFTIWYTNSDVSLIDEATLKVYYWNETEWVDALQTCIDAGIIRDPRYSSNPDENYVQLPVCHLSRFGLVGN